MNDKVVITGTGLVTSLGNSAKETWDALIAGKCGIYPIEDFDARGFDCHIAAQVKGLEPSKLDIHPRDSRIMDKHSYMLLKCSREAFKQSRLDKDDIPPEDIGYFAGMGMVDYNIEDLLPSVLKSLDSEGALNYSKFFLQEYQQIHPLWPLSMLNNISFCQVAIDLGIKGENTVFSPHADSGIHAIIEAYNTVKERKAKVVLAGGVSEKVSPLSLARASWFGILNTSGKDNHTGCRPFGKDRKGTILGEGCGVLALELESSARKRQTPWLAGISGYGTSFEKSKEANCPTTSAISLSMKETLNKAGLQPEDIDLIIAHGDGTYRGDKNEIEAINHTFADCIDKVKVFSSKAAIGHLLAGSPVVDIILGIYIFKNGIIPPVYNSLPIDSHVRFNLISREPVKVKPKRILINSQSYEGQCASLIIEAMD
jgi:3-oxoacyl-[acyl-carrier-protein] synthase II